MNLRTIAVLIVLGICVSGGYATLHSAVAQSPAPPLTPLQEERQRLFDALKKSKEPRIAKRIEGLIWEFWMNGPDENASARLRAVMRERRARNFDGAMKILDKLVKAYPSWSEGWNQRATVLFEKGDYDASLKDIEIVLELEPKHFGALAGKAIILMRQGRMGLGQRALRRAVDIHPWLRERSLLKPGEEI